MMDDIQSEKFAWTQESRTARFYQGLTHLGFAATIIMDPRQNSECFKNPGGATFNGVIRLADVQYWMDRVQTGAIEIVMGNGHSILIDPKLEENRALVEWMDAVQPTSESIKRVRMFQDRK